MYVLLLLVILLLLVLIAYLLMDFNQHPKTYMHF